MRGGALPPALLMAALALLLARTPPKARSGGALMALGALSLCLALRLGLVVDSAFLGLWISVIATSAAALPTRLPSPWIAFALAANAGFWAGASIVAAGDPMNALPVAAVLLAMPLAAWLSARGGGVGLKVVASWLIAIAVLATALQLGPVSPGYLPDHLE
jgi:hypothetical protein